MLSMHIYLLRLARVLSGAVLLWYPVWYLAASGLVPKTILAQRLPIAPTNN